MIIKTALIVVVTLTLLVIAIGGIASLGSKENN